MTEDNIGKGFKLINCDVYFGDNLVGGVQKLSIKREDDNTTNWKAGSLDPVDITLGKRTYTGSVEHLWLSTSGIKNYQNFTSTNIVDEGDYNDYYFNIQGVVQGTSGKKITIKNVKFKGLAIDLDLESVSAVQRDFDALGLDFE